MENELATQVEDKTEPTMEDTIRETYSKIQDRGDTGGDSGEESTDNSVEKEIKEALPNSGKSRDETGKFKKEENKTEEVKPSRKAPNSWKPEAQSKFGTLDALVQDEIERREADFHKGLESYKSKATFADEMEKAVSPYMATIRSMNITPAHAVQTLMSADHSLRYGTPTQKLNMLQQVANEYGIDLRQIQQGQQVRIDPNISALQQQIQQLQGVLQTQEQTRSKAEEAEAHNSVNAFKADPKNEHFDAVNGDMAILLSSGAAKDLREAYDKAVWANPNTRQLLIAKQQEEARADAKKKADEAKQAAAINVKPRGRIPVTAPVGSMEDTIRAKARELNLIR